MSVYHDELTIHTQREGEIIDLTKDTLYSSSAPDIIGGLTEDANKSAKKSVGRTFVGVQDRDQDQQYETVLIFSTKTARQEDAGQVLKDFGADKVMMLDGGDSTQLICQDNAYRQIYNHSFHRPCK